MVKERSFRGDAAAAAFLPRALCKLRGFEIERARTEAARAVEGHERIASVLGEFSMKRANNSWGSLSARRATLCSTSGFFALASSWSAAISCRA